MVNVFEDESNPETLRMVEAAKRREEEERRVRGGFSPFQPHMSFSSAASSSNLSADGVPVTISSDSTNAQSSAFMV